MSFIPNDFNIIPRRKYRSQPCASFRIYTENANIIKENGCEMYFFNINVKEILGDLYYQYDRFTIEIGNFFTNTGSSSDDYTSNIPDNLLYLSMGGLEFENCSTSLGTNIFENAFIFSYQIFTNSANNPQYKNKALFKKNEKLTTLNLSIKKINSVYPQTNMTTFPLTFFIFHITPFI